MRFLRKNAIIILFLYALEAGAQNMHEYSPVEGYLPDSATAIAVAEIILKKIYGIDQIEKQRPFVASLSGEVWKISGSTNSAQLGGVASIDLQKNGRVVRVSHSR